MYICVCVCVSTRLTVVISLWMTCCYTTAQTEAKLASNVNHSHQHDDAVFFSILRLISWVLFFVARMSLSIYVTQFVQRFVCIPRRRRKANENKTSVDKWTTMTNAHTLWNRWDSFSIEMNMPGNCAASANVWSRVFLFSNALRVVGILRFRVTSSVAFNFIFEWNENEYEKQNPKKNCTYYKCFSYAKTIKMVFSWCCRRQWWPLFFVSFLLWELFFLRHLFVFHNFFLLRCSIWHWNCRLNEMERKLNSKSNFWLFNGFSNSAWSDCGTTWFYFWLFLMFEKRQLCGISICI